MQYRSDWERLGISQTTDITAIKKAFAARTREYHPEEHPEEFMALQKAYKAAVAYAKAAKEIQKREAQGHKEQWESGVTLIIPNFEQTAWQEEPEQSLSLDTVAVEGENGGRQMTENASSGQRLLESTAEEFTGQESFDYGEIARKEQEQTERRFFCGFDAIAENACICYNDKIWRTFLRMEEYQPYFEREDFCRRLLDAIVQRNYLTEEIVRVLVEKLGHNAVLEAALKGDSSDSAVRLYLQDKKIAKSVRKIRKMTRRRLHLPKVVKHSKEMLDFHQIVLRKARLSGFSADIGTWQGAAEYLDIYLPYAMEYLEQIRKTGRSSRRIAQMVNGMFGLGVVTIAAAVLVNLWVLPHMGEDGKVPVLQRQFEENMGRDSLFDDNLAPESDGDVYLGDMEDVMTDMLDRYEKWQQESASESEEKESL